MVFSARISTFVSSIFVSLLISSTASAVTSNDTEAILDWVEVLFPTYFPEFVDTKNDNGWKVRDYSSTGLRVAVSPDGDLYAAGGSFGEGTNVAPVAAVMKTETEVTGFNNRDIERFFTWAEDTFPTYFSSAQSTRTLLNWRFRYYPETGIHLAVNDELEVYGIAHQLGGLIPLGSLCSFLRELPDTDNNLTIMEAVASEGMDAPGMPEGSTLTYIGEVGIGDCGQIAFSGQARDENDELIDGVWAGYPGSLKLVAEENQTISGLAPNILFSKKHTSSGSLAPIVTTSGNVGFLGSVKGASSSLVLMASVDGVLTKIVSPT